MNSEWLWHCRDIENPDRLRAGLMATDGSALPRRLKAESAEETDPRTPHSLIHADSDPASSVQTSWLTELSTATPPNKRDWPGDYLPIRHALNPRGNDTTVLAHTG